MENSLKKMSSTTASALSLCRIDNHQWLLHGESVRIDGAIRMAPR